VRVALPQKTIRERIHQTIYKSILLGTLIGGIIAAVISFFVARSFSRPIKQIKDAAVNISEGDFHYRLKLERKDELHQVAESLNEMSEKLGVYFASINEERERISTILSGMKEELILISADDTIYLANENFCRLFGLEKNIIVGKKYWEAVLIQEVSEFIRNALQSERFDYSDLPFRKNGKIYKHYRMSASPILSEKGKFRGIVVIFHDVTLIKEMENMRREFVDNASHELKTPISSVLAVSETLIDKEPPDAQTRIRFYQTIHENAHRLNNLINDLLSLSEIEQAKGTLKSHHEDIGEILKDCLEVFSPAIKNKKHTVKWEWPDNVPSVPMDRKSFAKAVGNILDNAIRYTEKNGEIIIRGKVEKNGINIYIEDSGIGVPAEDIDRIFERFYRVDKARSIKLGGTGLGLSIAKHIIEAHGGQISVESTQGKGSIFSIYLPLSIS
jgi:two-component system phosphate regulon sensor histidine kinase PhoR